MDTNLNAKEAALELKMEIIRCPKCGSQEVIKFGKTLKHQQRYACKRCYRIWVASYA